MKTNYKSGKYKLVKEVIWQTGVDSSQMKDEEIYLNLTSLQAKVLLKDHFYSDLGFKEIEYIQE